MGDNANRMEQPAIKVSEILRGIKDKIERNPLLREVYNRKNGDFDDLIEKYSGEKVMMAVQLVESYGLLVEMEKKLQGLTCIAANNRLKEVKMVHPMVCRFAFCGGFLKNKGRKAL